MQSRKNRAGKIFPPMAKFLQGGGKIFTGGWQNFYRGVAKFCHNNIYIIYLKYRDIIYTRFARKKSPSRFPFGKQKTHSKSDTAKQNRRQNLHQGKERKKTVQAERGIESAQGNLKTLFFPRRGRIFPYGGNRTGSEICFGFRARELLTEILINSNIQPSTGKRPNWRC